MSFEQRRVAKSGGMLDQLTPVVKALLILNLGIYFADLLFFEMAILEFGQFTITRSIYEKHVWEFITFQFMHGSVGHVLANSLGLFFFGPFVERWLGWMRFLIYYLACGIGGAAFFVLLVYLKILPGMDFYASLVGASAGIYGIIIAVAVLVPHLQVSLLFPPITLTMRQLALTAIAIAVAIILFGIGDNEGGEAGHLGGAIVGFLLIRMVPVFGIQAKKTPRAKKRPGKNFEPKIRPRTIVDLRAQSEVDEILDKISREGFQSLTDEERDLLHRASKNQQD
ncbi:MAG: rhomboid family intramembrane serine protease [Verrucomicrobiota bacterium]